MKHQATVGSNDLSASRQGFVSLVALLIDRAQHQPTQKAYTFLANGTEADELTYAALHLKARSIAAQLQSLKLAGERALLLYPPGLEYIAAFFGCLYAQIVAVPAYPPRRNQNLSRLQAIVADSQPKVVLTTAALKDTLQDRFAQELNLTDLHWLGSDLDCDGAEDWRSPPLDSDTLAFLQYTSGSTGNPKGVMISHGNLLHNLEMIHTCFAHNADSRGLIWLPPYHDMGLIGGVLQPLYGGFPVTLMSPVDFLQKPFRWLQAISQYQATTSGGPNFAYDLCVQKTTPEQRSTLDLSGWEVAFTGAEPVRAETLDRFAEAFEPCGFRKAAFYPCYGMAEGTLIISGGLKTDLSTVRQIDSVALEQNRVVEVNSEEARSVVSCGWSWLGQEILIVDPDTRLVCEENRVGEIWVSGPSVAQGYWQRTDETQQAFHAHLATGEGPLMRTGDLGFFHRGELFITGRLKDVIIIRGQNHYPHDIELTVAKSHPALRLNCGAAFAVEVKGAERLVIVQEVERSYLRKLNVKEAVSSIRQEVVAQHGLEIYATVLVKTGSIPKTSSGKIRRHACRTLFQTGSLEVVDDWSENLQGTSKFLNLQAEVESMLQKLQVNKQN